MDPSQGQIRVGESPRKVSQKAKSIPWFEQTYLEPIRSVESNICLGAGVSGRQAPPACMWSICMHL